MAQWMVTRNMQHQDIAPPVVEVSLRGGAVAVHTSVKEQIIFMA